MNLHLQYSWINMLAVSFCICGGFIFITRRLLSLIHNLEVSEANLNREIAIRQQAHVELQEIEGRFRDLIEGSTQGIVIRRDDKALFVNQAFVEIFGYDTPEDILRMDSLLPLAAPHEHQRLRHYHEAREAREPSPFHYEFQGVRRDGVVVWLDIHIRVITWEGLPATQATVFDITKRKQAERDLRESEAQFRLITDSLPVRIIYVDRELRYRFVNKTCEAWFGRPSSDIIGRTVPEIFGADYHKVEHLVHRALAGETTHHEHWFPFSDGRERFVRTIYAPHRSEAGDTLGYFALSVDMTEQHRAEAALSESEARFRQLAEAAFDGIMISEEARILEANPSFAQMYGYEVSEVIGLSSWEMTTPESAQRIWESIQAGYERPYEITGIKKDGTTFDLEVVGKNGTYQGRNVRVVAMRDISERKQAEARIARHNQELEQAVQEKTREMEALMARMVRHEKLATIGQISGSIAHELRNPLGTVKQSLFFLDRLRQSRRLVSDNHKVLEHLHLMDAEIDSAERVTSQLLTFARAQPPRPEWLDLDQLVDHAIRQEQWGDGMQLRTDFDPVPFALWGDRWHLQHVLANLLSNAADACSQEGMVTIRAEVDGAAQEYQITVRDTGCGIPADELEHVFEPLYTRKVWGTGLGLSLCQQLMEQQGGAIALESQNGQGTAVHLRLPLPSDTRARPAAKPVDAG